ncbi:MAG: aspartate dehydrogenase [bacterium]|nr:aspartate dehydrogenase [bacterium]
MMKKVAIPKIKFVHFGKIPYYEKHLTETIPFDPDTQYAVLKTSICTGERIAGFKNKEDGSFTEVLLIRTDADLERFQKMYGIASIKKEY